MGAITTDFNSLREDDLTRGPLIRRVEVINNSINGIYIRAELSGEARQTDAIDYPDNPLPRADRATSSSTTRCRTR